VYPGRESSPNHSPRRSAGIDLGAILQLVLAVDDHDVAGFKPALRPTLLPVVCAMVTVRIFAVLSFPAA